MKAYPTPTLRIVADQLLALQRDILEETGEAPLTAYGLRLERGRLEVVEVPSPESPDDLPALLRELQTRFDVVCVAAEAWTAPDTTVKPSEHPQRQDSLTIVLYSQGAAHLLVAEILRDPLRIGNVTFAPSAVSGRYSAAG